MRDAREDASDAPHRHAASLDGSWDHSLKRSFLLPNIVNVYNELSEIVYNFLSNSEQFPIHCILLYFFLYSAVF